MQQIIEIKNSTDHFFIYWQLTDFCNFKCNYCPKFLNSGDFAKNIKPGFPTDQEITNFCKNLINEHLQGRELFLVLSGGEPTLHPLFPKIVYELKPYGRITVVTNGSRSKEWWQGLDSLPHDVNISLHPEFTKIDKINENGLYFLENNLALQFNLSCDPMFWDDTVDLYNKLDKSLKPFVIPKILNDLAGDRSNYQYTAEQTAWMANVQKFSAENKLRKLDDNFPVTMIYYSDGTSKILNNVYQLMINNNHIYTNWKCSAGSTGINVNFSGQVFAGICKQQQLGRLDQFKLLTEFVECDKEACVCPSDLRLTKYNPSFPRSQ